MSDDEIREELEAHIEMRAAEYRAEGMSEADARATARRQFGNTTMVQEDTRAVWVSRIADEFRQDLQYALRGFLRNPGFALTAIIAAALGIGPTTAVFSIVDRLLFRALPYADAERLVSVGILAPLDSNEFMFASGYNDLRRDPGPFAAVTAFQAGAYDCDLTDQNPLRMRCMKIDANFLETLGIQPLAGRTFSTAENSPNGPPAVLITYALWQKRFGSAPNVVGQWLPIDGAPVPIVGVLPKDFEIPTLAQGDVMLPLVIRPTERNGRAFRVFARLKPGITLAQAREQLQPYFARTLLEVPPAFRKEVSLKIQAVRDRQVGDARLASVTLAGSVLAVLLIACANIATILLARSVVRQREMAMRLALGASRGRLARQVLTESVLLAVCGGLAGVGLAWALVRTAVAMAPGSLPRLEQATIDLRVLLFAVGASVAAGLVFGIAPALRRPAAQNVSGWRSGGRISSGVRTVLVTVQIAVSVVLLTGAGLLLKSLRNLESVPLGLETNHVVAAKFALSKQRFPDAASQLNAFYQVEQRLQWFPGVTQVAVTDSMPPTGGTRARPLASIAVEGQPRRPEGTGGMVVWRYVSPNYFPVLGIRMLRGRGFVEDDRRPGEQPVVLSESLAKLMFPGEDPLGKRILKNDPNDWFTVIGVAADVRNLGLQKSSPEYYLLRKLAPDATWNNQEPPMGWRGAYVVVRTAFPTASMAQGLRQVLSQLDPSMPVEIQTMRERVDGVTRRPRFNAILLSVFAGIGVVLAAVGLYGVIAFLVSQSTQEIGIRMALGASPMWIAGLILRRAAVWTAAGSALGVVGALLSTKMLKTLLFGVPERDPWTIAGVVATLFVVAMAAACAPGIRAARVDPATTLRQD